MRRILIGHYIRYKQRLEDRNEPNAMAGGMCWIIPKPLFFMRKAVSVGAGKILFQKNRTLSDLRHRFDLFILGAGKNPPDMSSADRFAREYDRNPGIRNILGWFMVSIAEKRFSWFGEAFVRTKILSDLLAIEIGNCIGRSVILKDCYSGQPYQMDRRTGRMFSVGSDRIPLTEDDISFDTAPKDGSGPSKRTLGKSVLL